MVIIVIAIIRCVRLSIYYSKVYESFIQITEKLVSVIKPQIIGLTQ